MVARAEDALANNLAWYRAMMDAHGIAHETREHYWSASDAALPYYSNFVTRTGAEGCEAQLVRAREMAATPPQAAWSIADSFATLPGEALAALGLTMMFEAKWYARAPAKMLDESETAYAFEPVRNAAGLTHWVKAWQRWSPTGGQTVFPASLLDSPGVTFWAARDDGGLVGGAITHGDNITTGLSNVFLDGSGATGAFLRDAARNAMRAWPDRTVVGYGPASDLTDLVSLGFVPLGPLRVWIAGGRDQP